VGGIKETVERNRKERNGHEGAILARTKAQEE